jgi:hypothetical protein
MQRTVVHHSSYNNLKGATTATPTTSFVLTTAAIIQQCFIRLPLRARKAHFFHSDSGTRLIENNK